MLAAYVIVTLLAAIANAFSSALDLLRHERVAEVMDKGNVAHKWMIPLGVVKGAGVLGLLIGFAVPLIGTAAATGLVLFYLGALVVHLRARYYEFGNLAVFLTLSTAALVVTLVYRGPW